jgi:hypothetical protein
MVLFTVEALAQQPDLLYATCTTAGKVSIQEFYMLHLSSTLKLEAACSFKVLVSFHMPADSNFLLNAVRT